MLVLIVRETSIMKIILKIVKVVLLLVALLAIVYFLGPKVGEPDLNTDLPEVTANLVELEAEINNRELQTKNIRPDNEARIIWADTIPKKTKYSIVYLHGWSASQEEGNPIHLETAKRYGCNLYLPRLAGHGLAEAEPMLNLTADEVINSAKEAIAIGKQLGEKVILMATSTGGTLALHLAGGDTDVASLVMYSPNIEIYDPNAKLLARQWGLKLAKFVKDSDYHEFDTDIDLKNQYWTTKYRLEALTHLQAMVDYTMVPETFEKITQPTFLGYFYKNDTIQDNVVSVPAMLTMFDELGTSDNLKRKIAFSKVGDHVMTSHITSKDLESVRRETNKFFEEILHINPK